MKFVEESKADMIKRWESEGRLDPNCPSCKEFYTAAKPTSVFAPNHKPSDRCESGKHPHCSCDTCF